MQGDEFSGYAHDDIDGLGNAGETVTDCNIGVSKCEYVNSGICGVDCLTGHENVYDMLAAGESFSYNDLLLNSDNSNEGDRDRGVSNDGLNKLVDDSNLGGSREDVFDLVVIADLFLGCPGGLCILACCFFS